MNPYNPSRDDSVDDQVHSRSVEQEEVHRGYDLETGMFIRAHEWIDLFPSLRLIRVLRVAGSPPLLMLTAIVLSLWFAGQHLILAIVPPANRSFATVTATAESDDQATAQQATAQQASGRGTLPAPWAWFAGTPVVGTPVVGTPFSLTTVDGDRGAGAISSTSVVGRVAIWIWSILIGSPLALLLARQGALLTAGRPMMSLGLVIRLALQRTPASWLTLIVPMLCLIPFVLAALFALWVSGWLPDFQPLQVLIGMVVGVILVVAGVLGFGALFAVPISWAALINEQASDPLDSLSRGYEYFLRRPVQLVINALLSIGLVTILGSLATGVAVVAQAMVATVLQWVTAAPRAIEATEFVVGHFPTVVVATLMGSLLGGVYLLLRYDAGRQEVEDLWEGATAERRPLPDLPKQG